MDNPQVMINSAGMPLGTRTVYIYRLTAPPTPPAFPLAEPGGNTGAGASASSNTYCTGTAVLLGAYNLEMFGWRDGGKEIDRMTPLGADQDFAVLRGKITGSATVQLALGTTPTLRAGIDIFELSPGYEKDGATALPLQRFVITNANKDENEGAANKMTVSLRFDRQNSDQFWQS
jgi:hypothetical protein